MKDFLTTHAQMQLRKLHHQERDRKVADRIKAVLLANEGKTYVEIGHFLLLHHDTVAQHVKEYLESEKLGLNYTGRAEKLTPEQCVLLEAELDLNLYS